MPLILLPFLVAHGIQARNTKRLADIESLRLAPVILQRFGAVFAILYLFGACAFGNCLAFLHGRPMTPARTRLRVVFAQLLSNWLSERQPIPLKYPSH